MIEIIKAIILGTVEGITEFLPISSTGHLILINQWISFEKEFTNTFDIVIQLGAILAVVWHFRSKLIPWEKIVKKENISKEIDLWKNAIIGVIPAIILGLVFGDGIENYLFRPDVVMVMLIIGGIFLWIIERQQKNIKITSTENISPKLAFTIGIIQCFAMIPGTSRSASTIIGAILLGCSRTVAAEFSFFLAIPTMIAASGYSLLKNGTHCSIFQLLLLCIGFIMSFLVAKIVITKFLNYIQNNDFTLFAYYRVILGIVGLIYIYL